MIVCVCHRVSDRQITQQVREGCGSFEQLQVALGVATRCGTCRQHAQATFDAARCACADSQVTLQRMGMLAVALGA